MLPLKHAPSGPGPCERAGPRAEPQPPPGRPSASVRAVLEVPRAPACSKSSGPRCPVRWNPPLCCLHLIPAGRGLHRDQGRGPDGIPGPGDDREGGRGWGHAGPASPQDAPSRGRRRCPEGLGRTWRLPGGPTANSLHTLQATPPSTPSSDVGTSGFSESQRVRAVRRQQGPTLTRLWLEPPAMLGPRQLVGHISQTHHRYTHV